MNKLTSSPTVLVIPCSGIGKVHGLLGREATYRVTDVLMPGQAATLCLALLVTGDAGARAQVQDRPCITVDGCPKLCAQKNVELAGGTIALGVRVHETLKRHRGGQFGTATTLTEEGWTVVQEIGAEIAETARRMCEDAEVRHG